MTDYNLELYKIIIEETRNIHTQWINNFRVILTFNSFILTASVGLILLLIKEGVDDPEFIKLMYSILTIASTLGIIVTLIGISLIYRLHVINRLRQEELRRIENRLSDKFILLPFVEGYQRFFIKKTNDNKIKPLKFRLINGFIGYVTIFGVFIIINTLLLIWSLYKN